MIALPSPDPLLPSPLLTTAPTLADVIAAVAAADLPAATAQRIAGDVRIVAGWLGQEPDRIPAHPGVLRQKLAALHPAQVGLSAKRLANIRANVRRGLELAGSGAVATHRPAEALTGSWRAHHDRIAGTWRVGKLSQFIRYCAAHGIAPEAVDEAAFAAWGAWRADSPVSIARDPHKAVLKAQQAWNGAVAAIPGWPARPVVISPKRRRVTRDLANFPQGLQDDLARFQASRGVRSADAPRRFRQAAGTAERAALSASKVQRCADAVLLAATTAVEAGYVALPAADSIRAVLSVDVAEATLEAIAARNDLTEYVLTVAKNFACVARRWLDLTDAERADWDDLVRSTRATLKAEARFDPYAMTRRNRERLAQFTDRQAVSRLFSYPWAEFDALEAERRRRGGVSHEMALRAMSAIAVALLTTLPLRRGSLQRLTWDRHVVLPPGKGPGRLALDAHEVKNRRTLAAPLAPETVTLLRLYRRHYWPALTDDPANPHLFPAAQGPGPRAPGQLATNVVTRVRARTGLAVNLHLFRHLLATLALARAAEGGDLARASALVEGLLGATPGSRVTGRYAELSAWMAAEWSDERIAQPLRSRARLRVRREWTR